MLRDPLTARINHHCESFLSSLTSENEPTTKHQPILPTPTTTHQVNIKGEQEDHSSFIECRVCEKKLFLLSLF